jgi:predicted MFS family arabinose efflux permease
MDHILSIHSDIGQGIMASASPHIRPAAGRPEQISTRIVFFVAGFGTAAWAPLVPFAKARAELDERTLGLLLLCLGVGSVMAMPLAGATAARLGCRRVIMASTALLCLTLPLLTVIASPILLAAALLAFGAGLGATDVTMNIQAIIVERASGRSMMSGFHGLFSLGGIVGAACMTALLAAGASPLAATLCVVAAIVVAVSAAVSHLLPYGSQGEGPIFALPHGVVLFIGCVCFVAFLAEGAMLDWSAVFLTSVRGMEATYGGLGYAAFALTMTIGRLTGDRIVRRYGGPNVITVGGLCAAVGFALSTLVPAWQIAMIGYALIGVGCSNIVPVLYSSVGRQTVMPEHVAVPAITTLGYAGILAGPAAIGFVAHAASLSTAFLILAILQVGVAASGRLLRV